MFDVESAQVKKTPESAPIGCPQCHGRPWVTITLESGDPASSRCACARGRWLAEKDRERREGGRR